MYNDKRFALTDLQRAYYTAYSEKAAPTYIIKKIAVKNADPERLRRAVRELIAYYDILRCRMYDDRTQEIIPFDEKIADECFKIIHLTENHSYEIEKKLEAIEQQLQLQIGEPEKPRLFTTLLVMLPDEYAYLYLKIDGLITDGKSADILVRTLDKMYCGCTCADLPPIPSYRSYCESREREVDKQSYEKSKDYWKAEMEKFAEPFALPMLEGYEKREHRAAIELKATLTREDSEKITQIAHRNHISETALRLAAFCKTAELYNENDSFQVNVPYDKRLSAEYETIFGECADYYIYKYKRKAGESLINTAVRINSELQEIHKFLAFSGNEITLAYMRYTQDYQSTFFPVVYTDLCDLKEYDDAGALKVVDMFSHTSGIWMDAVLYKTADQIRINLDSNEGFFKDGFLADFLSSFISTLKSVENWDTIFQAYLPSGEAAFLRKFNDTAEKREYIPYSQMIEKSISLRKKEIAVYTENAELSYEMFYANVRNLAAYISDMHIKHERIAVILGKGLDVLLWAQAIVLSGNVYVPLDCDYPMDTMSRCLSILGAKKIVTNNTFLRQLSHVESIDADDIINIDALHVPIRCNYQFVACEPMDPFAIIHTSGSTGLPKAVELTHNGILNTLAFSVEKFEIRSDDKILALTNHCHDMSLFDMFGMFIAGGTVSVIEHFHWQDPYVWAEQIKQHHLTLWNSVPSIMEAFLDIIDDAAKDVLNSLRLIIHGGEAIPIAEVRKLEKLAGKSRLLSVGGPTETSIWSIYHFAEAGDADAGIIPYGVPISNMKYRLLNKNGIDVPFHVRGTMFVSGAGTAECYIDGRDPEKFVIDKTGTLWYNTGDLGVYDRNGYIVFSGRADNQIKRFGKRIELDGIERTAMNFCNVTQAKVLIDERNSDILLYYSADTEKRTEQMRSALLEHLPEYMVPQHYIFVKNMPLTHNGKIDSKQLRKLTKTEKQTTHPTNSDTIDSGFREFADIVRNSLGIERDMIPDDNFFMCGGTSLKAMKLSAEIKKHYGKSINLRTFFMIPVIGDLYKAVLGTAEKKMAISDEDKLAKKLPLTYLQQFIFLSELMNQTVEKFILTAYTDYDEIFNQKAFRKSCMLVWEKHKSLHYEFQIDRSGEPYQIFSKEKCNYREIIAVKACDDFDSEVAELSKWHPNILNGQNGRIVLLENKMKNISRIVITLHHAVSDERTFSIMFAEIEDVYHKICRENQIRKLAYDNAFAAYTLEKNRKQYAEISVDYLPKTVKMPGANTDANDGEMIIFEKSLSSMQALSAYCSAKGTTEFVGLLTAAIISFSLLTENDENGFVIPLSERYDYDMPDAVGVFIDEYLLHFRLAKEQTFGEVLSEVDKAYIRMISNGADSYREALKKKGLLDDFYKNRTYYPYFSYFESTSEKGRDMDFYEKQNDSETELMFVIKKSKDQYTLMLSYKNSFCKKEEAEKLVQLFGCVLDRMIDTPDCCVATCFDAQDNDVAQTDDTIEQVKAAWEEVLNQKCDDCDLNFFDAGGYSFLLYQLSAAVNRHTGRKIPFIALMTYPTIHSLAAYIEEDDDD